MERVFAFTDEYGSFGWKLDSPDVSTHFIITSIIIEESKIDEVRKKAEEIRKHFFQSGEIKSRNVGKNHRRRKIILAKLLELDFAIFPVVIDKRKVSTYKGLRYKESFYKFMNNIVHKELKKAFCKLTVVADEIGSNDYMQSFKKYFEKNSEPLNLFEESNLMFEDSKSDPLVQIADFISGTLSYVYDDHKKDPTAPNYLKMLEPKLTYVRLYPKEYHTFQLNGSVVASDYDEEIAELCFKQAATFLEKNKDSDDPDIKSQCIVLDYLMFRIMNNSTRKYIPTKELINQLIYTNNEKISTSTFRLKVICKLRDAGVIIASSQKGYKIPTKEAELYDFIDHGVQVVLPMLERLKKCRNIVKLSTKGHLDLLQHDEYRDIKRFFDIQDENEYQH